MTVYDIMPAGMDEVAAAGAEKGSSPKDVSSKTDIIITMVPDGPEVEQAVLGPNGVLEGARKGSTVIDVSSISPMVSQKVGAALEAKGIEFLDAPVSGGEPKASWSEFALDGEATALLVFIKIITIDPEQESNEVRKDVRF